MICIDARHAKAALSMQINKSDRNDATRALLNSRALLVKIKRDLENQIRGLLKCSGLVIGRATGGAFTQRANVLLEGDPALAEIIEPLLDVRDSVHGQLVMLDRRVHQLAQSLPQTRAFMTVPGIGPITALSFMAAIDDPARFKRTRNVGAYLGLTPRRCASGEVDWQGRISKCGDAMARTYLFEAAGVLLTRVQKWCALKAWGLRIAKRSGMKKARIAVAR